jgi:hypothetical protein
VRFASTAALYHQSAAIDAISSSAVLFVGGALQDMHSSATVIFTCSSSA